MKNNVKSRWWAQGFIIIFFLKNAEASNTGGVPGNIVGTGLSVQFSSEIRVRVGVCCALCIYSALVGGWQDTH